jgi:outer membrane protein TolC
MFERAGTSSAGMQKMNGARRARRDHASPLRLTPVLLGACLVPIACDAFATSRPSFAGRDRIAEIAAAPPARSTSSDSAATESLGVEDFIHAALRTNTTLRVARATGAEAAGRAEGVRVTLFPHLDLDLGYQRVSDVPHGSIPVPAVGGAVPPEILIGDRNNYDLRLDASYIAYSGGRTRSLLQAASLSASAAALDVDRQARQIAYDVTAAFWEVVKAERLLDAARASRAQLAEHTRVLQARTRQGMALASDVLRAEVRVTQADLAIVRAERALTVSRVALLNLVGMPLATRFVARAVLPPQPEVSAAASRAASLEETARRAAALRPDISSRTMQVGAAARRLDAARAAWRPSLSLTGTLGYARPGLNKFETEWSGYWTLGVLARWEVFDGGARGAEIDVAEAALERATAQEAQTRNDVLLDVTRAHLLLVEAERQVDLTSKSADQAGREYRILEARFREGVVTSTDVLDAQSALAQARDEDVRARADYAAALANWARATGEQVVAQAEGWKP